MREFKILKGDSQEIRRAVFKRDAGVCAQCGMDTELERTRAQAGMYCNATRIERELKERRMLAGFPVPSSSWWEADHITPLIEGGTNTLANFRTLCVVCHKAETARLAARRARARREPRHHLTLIF